MRRSSLVLLGFALWGFRFQDAIAAAQEVSLTPPLERFVSEAPPKPLFSSRSFLPWRDQASGGLNVLYCYLTINGVRLEYSDLRRQHSQELGTNDETVATLARLAAKNGLPLRAFSLTMDELRSCAKPVIVHMDGETPQTGAFLLVFGTRQNRIYFVNGPSAAIHMMTPEDFRRVWSGVALLPAPHRKQDMLLGIIGGGTGFLLSLSVSLLRAK